jgi:hypothetical protein
VPLPFLEPDWPRPPIPSAMVPAPLELAGRDVEVLRSLVIALALTLEERGG